MGIIFDIKKYAIHDGPGIRTTVFFKGCPLRCAWCHNPESWKAVAEPLFRPTRCQHCGRCVEVCPEHAVRSVNGSPETDLERCCRCGQCLIVCPAGAREIAGREMSVDEVMQEVRKDLVFYDESGGGVTFSGGEPLMQPEFLAELLKRCRQERIHSTVDTSCYAERSVVEKISKLADLFLCDVKHIDPEKHKAFTGVDNRIILDNIRFLSDSGCLMKIRIPVVPGFNAEPETIDAIAKFVKSLSNIQKVDLLPYNSGGVFKADRLADHVEMLEKKPPSRDEMKTLCEIVRGHGLNVGIRG